MRGLRAACIIIILLLFMGYAGLAVYYRGGFAVNTWINGVYCTGRTVQEVNAVLLEQTETSDGFTVIGYDRTGGERVKISRTIPLEDLQYSLDYSSQLEQYLENQNAWLWAGNVVLHRNHQLKARIFIDEEALRERWEEICAAFHMEEDYRIEYSEETGYTLFDGLQCRLDEEKAYTVIREAVLSGQESADLTEWDCYYDVPLSEAQRKQARLWEKIAFFQENGPICDYGDGAEQPDSAKMAGLLEKDEISGLPLTDESGRFLLREGCVEEWVAEAAALHDTYNKEWAFRSTRGDIVKVKGVTYGTSINQKREQVWLAGYLERLLTEAAAGENGGYMPEVQVHIPEYTREAYNRSSTEIGDTYIEVDMGLQKLYYYEDGELRFETDVVTGNARRRMNTPEGVNFVYSKQKNRILRGEGYASPVKFWMPVKGSIGIHDADWRDDDEFGGDTYKTNGSHGCINVQRDVMGELFDMVEIGTPVVMFYGEEPESGTDAPQTK